LCFLIGDKGLLTIDKDFIKHNEFKIENVIFTWYLFTTIYEKRKRERDTVDFHITQCRKPQNRRDPFFADGSSIKKPLIDLVEEKSNGPKLHVKDGNLSMGDIIGK
jgi:hypothetical protein